MSGVCIHLMTWPLKQSKFLWPYIISYPEPPMLEGKKAFKRPSNLQNSRNIEVKALWEMGLQKVHRPLWQRPTTLLGTKNEATTEWFRVCKKCERKQRRLLTLKWSTQSFFWHRRHAKCQLCIAMAWMDVWHEANLVHTVRPWRSIRQSMACHAIIANYISRKVQKSPEKSRHV
jgi:hypothetical protein